MIAVVLAAPLAAHAEDPKVEAKHHVERATQLHKDGRFADALDELKTAYALDPEPQLLYAMGQLLVKLGRCAEAINYYQRFVDSKPEPEVAQLATEAIHVCQTNPPPEIVHVEAPANIGTPAPKSAAPAPASAAEGAPWYGDYIADGLVGAGVVGGVVSVIFYHAAAHERDLADGATSYAAYSSLVDSATSKRSDAIIVGAIGAGLIVGGAVQFMLSDRGHPVTVAPTAGGASITVAGRF